MTTIVFDTEMVRNVTPAPITKKVLKVQRLISEAKLPRYATKGAACIDFYAAEDALVVNNQAAIVRTGLAVEVPDGWALMLYSRSGHAFKSNVRLGNCTGVINSDYRGEILVKLTCDSSHTPLHVKKGERICQGMLIEVPQILLIEMDELSCTERGAGGFGSTGA